MARSAVAVVVGFTKRPGLLRKSFATLCKLKQAGILDRIVYVTWDRPDLDEWVSDAAAMPEVELVRIAEPAVEGQPYQKKHFYQTHNIAAAFALVEGDDTLILKTRPDVVLDENFIAGKILSFDHCCAPSRLATNFKLPRSPFAMKIWTPWADSNQPFFIEDGIFAGLKRDVAQLATPQSDAIVRDFADERSAWIVHVARYIVPFLKGYPIFNRYLKEFRLFAQNDACRAEQIAATLPDLFFWHLTLANAWVLANNFHVDCGYPGQIVFPPPEGGADKWAGKPLAEIPSRPPYDRVDAWRAGQKPGSILASVRRLYGRLVDDSWQRAIFTAPLSDLTPDNLQGAMQALADYSRGSLEELEPKYYAALQTIHQRHFTAQQPDILKLLQPAAA